MKFEDSDDLKEFLLWAKSEQIEHIKLGDLEVKFSQIGLATAAGMLEPAPADVSLDGLSPKREVSKEEEDELLFWSAKS